MIARRWVDDVGHGSCYIMGPSFLDRRGVLFYLSLGNWVPILDGRDRVPYSLPEAKRIMQSVVYHADRRS